MDPKIDYLMNEMYEMYHERLSGIVPNPLAAQDAQVREIWEMLARKAVYVCGLGTVLVKGD